MLPRWIVCAAAALFLVGSVDARAHAFLDHADPRVGSAVGAAPREVTLWFTQDLEPAFSTVTVTDASGKRVDASSPTFDGNVMRVPLLSITAGTYKVTWHALSVDTHTTDGAFTFSVGER